MRAAVIGAGPAGIYAARALLNRNPAIKVDILDRLPVPFGLIRYGVSPDHPSTKNAINQLSTIFQNPNISFLGNVPTGPNTKLPYSILDSLYNLTIHATGAAAPRTLPILQNPSQSQAPSRIVLAHDFARWANGHPELSDQARQAIEQGLLTNSSANITVIGVGNVAVDVARIILRPPNDMVDTDISPRALQVLQDADVRHVRLVGRKRPLAAKWTAAVLREVLTKVDGVQGVTKHALVARDLEQDGLGRTQRRCLKLLMDATLDEQSVSSLQAKKLLTLAFLQEPHSFRELQGRLVRTTLRTTDQSGLQYPEEVCLKDVDSDAVFLSLGYEGGNGLGYRVGWANGKGRGIIGDNKVDAESVVAALPNIPFADIKPGLAPWIQETGTEVVTWKGWKRIDEEESRRGALHGRNSGKIKLESISEMLEVARGPSPS